MIWMRTLKLFENFDSDKKYREKFAKLVSNIFSVIEDNEKWNDDNFSIHDEDYLNGSDDKIFIYTSIEEDKNSDNFKDIFKKIKDKYELFEKINYCLEILESRSENEIATTIYENQNNAIEIYLYEVLESGEFWNKERSGKIKIKPYKILRLIGLPKSCIVGISSDGTYRWFDIKFKSAAEKNEYSGDDIFKKLSNLKIDGLSIITQHDIYDEPSNYGEYSNIFTFKFNPDINFDWY